VGVNNATKQVHLIDFGSAKLFRDPRTYAHIPFRSSLHFTGTAMFASISAHLGLEISRRDDMESLAYILIYFLRGSLPWTSLRSDDRDLILQSKRATSVDDLCTALPSEFASFLAYTRSLAFEDKPDYDRFRKIFEALLSKEENPADTNVFDWDQPVRIKRALEEYTHETHPRRRKCESKLPNHRV
jgi:serine/threonine protein kinase